MRLGAGDTGGAAAPPGKNQGVRRTPWKFWSYIYSTAAKLGITQSIQFWHQNITYTGLFLISHPGNIFTIHTYTAAKLEMISQKVLNLGIRKSLLNGEFSISSLALRARTAPLQYFTIQTYAAAKLRIIKGCKFRH